MTKKTAMKRFLYLFFILSIFVGNKTYAHAGKSSYHVFIDSDCAIDDFRAITMLLAGHDIRVLGITASSGSLPAHIGTQKISELCADLYHEGVPQGKGDEVHIPKAEWEDFAKSIQWGTAIKKDEEQSAMQVLYTAIHSYQYPVTLIALGSLTTYAQFLQKHPQYTKNIDKIIWYNSMPIEQGYNYVLDTASYSFIAKSGVPLHIVSNTRADLVCSNDYISKISKSESKYAKKIATVHTQNTVQKRMKQNHLHLWDDLIPLYLTNPILFTSTTNGSITLSELSASIPLEFIYESIALILESSQEYENRVFSHFPIESHLYKKEYADLLENIYEKYGVEEWKAVVLTNEIHGHTGIYSIIGAKMGIRACEYFNVGVNNIYVTTYVGSLPPLSCFNDGVQISTGATIGQGLIRISDTVYATPTVAFTCNNKTVYMSIREDVAQKIRDDIAFGVKNYGLESLKYWDYIEELALVYWRDFDKRDIFNIYTTLE